MRLFNAAFDCWLTTRTKTNCCFVAMNTEALKHSICHFFHWSGARESQYQTMCVFIAFRTVRHIQSICTHTIYRYRGWDVSIVNCHPYPYSDTDQFTHIWIFLSSQRRIIAIFEEWELAKGGIGEWWFPMRALYAQEKHCVLYSFLIGVQNIEWGESPIFY